MRITWDEIKAASNQEKHDVSFDEASDVLFDPNAITLPDVSSDEERFATIGMSRQTKTLVVIYAYKIDDEIRLISARKATRKERKQYEKGI